MANATFQTTKLGKGRHRSPENGACVMELASMLAGEPFTDHPVSVCPVIASLLRAYNDSIDNTRRQDLYAYAAKVVGSHGSHSLQAARAERVRAWSAERAPSRRNTTLLDRLCRILERILDPPLPIAYAGASAIHAVTTFDDELHASVLTLIDDLLALGTPQRTEPSLAAASPCEHMGATAQAS